MNFVWKRDMRQYSDGYDCMLGTIKVGSVFRPSVSKGETAPFRARSELPGLMMKSGTTDFDNEQAARDRVERFVSNWFKATQA